MRMELSLRVHSCPETRPSGPSYLRSLELPRSGTCATTRSRPPCRDTSAGLQGQIAYTYSKCMTDSIGYFGSGGQAAAAAAYWQNLYDRRAEWGPCYYDVTYALRG